MTTSGRSQCLLGTLLMATSRCNPLTTHSHLAGVSIAVVAPDREPPDAVLIRRFLDGDERAFRTLYERHTPRLTMVVRRLLGFRQQEGDDVVQETWLAACRGIHAYRGDGQFSAW